MVYFPEIKFDGPLPPAEPYFNISRHFWKRPQNWADLVDAIRWAAQGDIPLEVMGPDFLVANLIEQPETRKRLVHLVNYNPQMVPIIENIEVLCAVPAGQAPAGVNWLTPDSNAAVSLDFRTQGQYARFAIPKLNTYGVAVIRW